MFENYSMNDGFLRQRRNLIISSIFVFFIHFTTIEIDKVSVFGISFDIIKKSNDLLYGLYLFWIYFMIRYMQYFYDYGFHRFIGQYSDLYKKNLQKRINKYICIKVPNVEGLNINSYSETIKRQGYKYYGKTNQCLSNEYGEKINNEFELEIPKFIYRIEKLKTILEVIFLKSMTTDFILPILLFLGIGIYVIG